MEWLQAFMIAGSTVGACYMMHKENRDLAKEFAKESKDFHGRLCKLEERYIHILEERMKEEKK